MNYLIAKTQGMEKDIFFRYNSEKELQLKLATFHEEGTQIEKTQEAEELEAEMLGGMEAPQCTAIYQERLDFDGKWDESPAYHSVTVEEDEDKEYFHSLPVRELEIVEYSTTL